MTRRRPLAMLRGSMQAFGAAEPDGRAPYDMQWSFRRDRAQLRAAAERMIARAPDRIVIAHGRFYGTNGVPELRRAFRWAL